MRHIAHTDVFPRPMAVDRNRTVGRVQDPGDHFEEGRLAGPVRADHGHPLACLDFKSEILQRQVTVISGAERPRHNGRRLNVVLVNHVRSSHRRRFYRRSYRAQGVGVSVARYLPTNQP